MIYTPKSTELINWVERSIDRSQGGSDRAKINVAIQTLALLAGILRAECPTYPNEEESYTIYVRAKKLLEKTEPDFHESFCRLVRKKEPRKGGYNINGVEAIASHHIFKSLTKAKARKLKSIVKKLNEGRVCLSSNYQFVESWCETLGLPINLIDRDVELNDLAQWLKAMYTDYAVTDLNRSPQILTA